MADSASCGPTTETCRARNPSGGTSHRRRARGVGLDLPADLRGLSERGRQREQGRRSRVVRVAPRAAAAGRQDARPAAAARPYALLAPGGIYLILGFILPLFFVVYTSLKSGGLLSRRVPVHVDVRRTIRTSSRSTKGFYLRSIVYSGIVTAIAILLAYPMAYWIAFYGGRWKSTLFFLILVPFFVSFVIRTVQWKFILGDKGLILGPAEEPGPAAGQLPRAGDPGGRDRRHHVQLPAVHGIAAVRLARTDRPAAGRGREGSVRDPVRGIPQGRAAAVVPGGVRRRHPHVRPGDRRLRELVGPRQARAPR